MPTRRPYSTSLTAPAAILALAAAMPLVVAGDVGGGPVAAMVAGTSQERAEKIARCVNEAARQFCGSHLVLPAVVPSVEILKPVEFVGIAPIQSKSHPFAPHLSPFVIDLPPPAL